MEDNEPLMQREEPFMVETAVYMGTSLIRLFNPRRTTIGLEA